MAILALLVILAFLWYLTRALGLVWSPARRLVARWSPWTGRLHAWVLTAPVTFAYAAIFSASTLLQTSAPPRLIDLLTTIQSTSIARLSTRPVSALVDSGLWVADRGAGLVAYLALFAIVVAWAERRYGSPRIVLIGLAGHVLGSLLTALVETRAIQSGTVPASLAYSTDVGVSYVMVACCGAAIVVMRGWRRAVSAVALGIGVVSPALIHHTMWDLGHLFATLCGLGMTAVTLAVRPLRRPVHIDTMAALVAGPTGSRRSAASGPPSPHADG